MLCTPRVFLTLTILLLSVVDSCYCINVKGRVSIAFYGKPIANLHSDTYIIFKAI